MKFEDVKFGMKVVPHTKTIGDCFLHEIFSKNDKYLVVCGFGRATQIQLINPTTHKTDFFYADNFYLYGEEPKLNYIEQVAKMLGVNIGEEFNIIHDGESMSPYSPHKFKNDKLIDKDGGTCNDILGYLIAGECKVQKIIPYAKPIKCSGGEQFNYVRIDGVVQEETFDGGTFSYAMCALNNMFPIDAIIPQPQIDEMVKKLRGDED